MKQNANGPSKPRDPFDALLTYLKRSRGLDLTGYKSTSLVRRVQKRIEHLQIENYERYIDYLEVHPEEFSQLFNHLLINVTSFFRDPQAWEYLDHEILPKIIAEKKPDDQIRVWSAGCAGGQEPYSVAMLLCERLGTERFQQQVKIYASDIDEEALTEARQASYAQRDIQGVPRPLFEKYFEPVGSRFAVRPDLRRTVIFGRHDLMADAPISRLDLLVCRNTLMYFNAEMQQHILARFHFALNDSGYLFLGKAEMLLTHADLFTPVELKYRIFMKVAKMTLRDRLLVLNQMGDVEAGAHVARQLRARELAFEMTRLPQFVVDSDGTLCLANSQARGQFSVTPKDVGRPFRDLEISYRPAELRGPIEQVFSERKPVQLKNVERPLATGTTQHFDVDLIPLIENGGTIVGVAITFFDVTPTFALQADLQRSKQELETAYEELQLTNEELTNEELQTTVEELETTNEELQSTNEELETMNEELQSTNEELQTVNTELRDRSDDLQRANRFQESILASLGYGVAVLDEQLNVLLWNHEAEEMWGVRADEVKGKSFVSLDIGLPISELVGAIGAALPPTEQPHTLKVSAVNRRGKAVTCRVSCSPLRDNTGIVHGVIVFMEEWNQQPDTSVN